MIKIKTTVMVKRFPLQVQQFVIEITVEKPDEVNTTLQAIYEELGL